jgi:hypothetical protein
MKEALAKVLTKFLVTTWIELVVRLGEGDNRTY